MSQHEQRRFPRFVVSNLPDLKCAVPTLEERLKLVTFGQGGCGFYCTESEERLRLPEAPELERKRRFQLRFEYTAKWNFDIQANLVYEHKVNINGQDVFYYGFEFIEAELPKIAPVVQTLEKLASSGEIGTC